MLIQHAIQIALKQIDRRMGGTYFQPGIVQSFLGSSRVLNYELKCPARPLGRCQQGENVDLCIPQGLCDLGHRTGSVFNPDCELLCLGHSETS